MILRRRLTLQLTPLLDLLLTVIFAQYLDMRITALRESRLADSERQAMVSQMSDMMQEMKTTEAELVRKKQELSTIRQDLDQHREQVRRADQETELIRRQMTSVVNIVKGMVVLPEDVWRKLISESQRALPDASPQDLERVRTEIGKLTRSQGTEIVDFFLTFDELRKRADIWDLYIREDGMIEVLAGGEETQFRTESAITFENRLFEIYKSLPQPKTVVILFISYGDARAIYRQAVFDGVPKAIERMNVDIQGRSRFEYAILGSRQREPRPAKPAITPPRKAVPE